MGREKKNPVGSRRVLDDISLLPQALQKQFLSDRETVLPYQQALEALAVLMSAHFELDWGGKGG